MIEIKRAAESDYNSVKELWKNVFGDSDEYIELFLKRNYEYCWVESDGTELMSMLFALPTKVNGRNATYLYACATAESFRGMNLMHGLIQSALAATLSELCVVLPAEDSLYDYYARLGFHSLKVNVAEHSREELLAMAKPFEQDELVVTSYCGIRNRVLKDNFLFWNNSQIETAFELAEIYGSRVLRTNFGYALLSEENGVCEVSELICADENTPYLLSAILSASESGRFRFRLSPNQHFFKTTEERFGAVKYLTGYRPENIYSGLTME